MKADKCGEMIRNLEDEKIIELYWARHESAIDETDKKYRTFCMYISRNILNDIFSPIIPNKGEIVIADV